MSKKPDTTDNENATVNLGGMGGWVDFDETEQSTQTDPAATLAFLNATEGVNFVNEFVRQYAEQQGYSDARTRLLGDKAQDAVNRYVQGHDGVKLRLVSHIDGLAIDDPVRREREAFWMLTNGKEFNAFLEAAGEAACWHDPAKTASEIVNAKPKSDAEWPAWERRNEFSDLIDSAIAEIVSQNGWQKTTAAQVVGHLVQLVSEATPPPLPFSERRIDHKPSPIEFHYLDYAGEPRTINRTQLRKRILNRLNILKNHRGIGI